MLILGLTGSIASGKSTASAMLRRLGIPVHDADAAVHHLLVKGGAAVPLIDAAFPGVVKQGAVDRGALGARVFGDPVALKRLEGILHPLVAASRDQFLRRAALAGKPLVVLDVPLLFETGGDKRCDLVLALTVPRPVQTMRVMRRPGMTVDKLKGIRARQMPDAEKALRADFVIRTGLGRRQVLQGLRSIVTLARPVGGRVRRWPPKPLPRYDRRIWTPRQGR